MKSSHQSSVDTSNNGGIILDNSLADSTKGREYRQAISETAWNELTEQERVSLSQVSRTVAGNDPELSAAYSQAMLIVGYVHRHTNIDSNPVVMLPAEHYRFWH